MAVPEKQFEEMLLEMQEKLAERKKELQEQLNEVNVRLSHVSGLLGPDMGADNSSANSVPRMEAVTDIAVAILSERAKRPMHYKDLAKEVLARGGDIPGKNPANNLVAKLVNDDRFVRPERRGCYALRIDYPGVESVGSRSQHGNNGTGQAENP